MYFARINLRLTQYDVGDMELKQFYRGQLLGLPKLDQGSEGIVSYDQHGHESK